MRLLLLPAVLLLAAAPGSAEQKQDVPEATPAGKPIDCLSGRLIRSTHVRNDKVIDFVMVGGKVYRNELPDACPGLGRERRFLHKSSLDQYCSIDTITVLQESPITKGATCGLGQFQPVTLASAN